jgi:hypothetical protein
MGNQDKSLLNLNSDAWRNARLKDTITYYGLRIWTLTFYRQKIWWLQTLRPIVHDICLPHLFCFSPGHKVSKHKLFQLFKDGRYSPHQNPILTSNGIWYSSTSPAKPTCICQIIRCRFRYVQTKLNTALYLEKKHGCTLIKFYVFFIYFYCHIKWFYCCNSVCMAPRWSI